MATLQWVYGWALSSVNESYSQVVRSHPQADECGWDVAEWVSENTYNVCVGISKRKYNI